MELDQRIREAENRLFAERGLEVEESFVDLPAAEARLRVLSVGAGRPLVMPHGVSLAAAVWAPWLVEFAGYRTLLVELPGHGLSGPADYRPGSVRGHALRLLDDLFDALGLDTIPVVGHSLGGMFALWHAAAPGGTHRVIGRRRRPRGRAARCDGPDAAVAPDRPGAWRSGAAHALATARLPEIARPGTQPRRRGGRP